MMQSPFSFISVLHVIAYLHPEYHRSPHFPEQHLWHNTFIHATWDFTITKSVVKRYYIIGVCLWKHSLFISGKIGKQMYVILLHNVIYHAAILALWLHIKANFPTCISWGFIFLRVCFCAHLAVGRLASKKRKKRKRCFNSCVSPCHSLYSN